MNNNEIKKNTDLSYRALCRYAHMLTFRIKYNNDMMEDSRSISGKNKSIQFEMWKNYVNH